MNSNAIFVSEEVQAAVRENRPVVALESTIFTHGLPRPRNLEVALEAEASLRAAGVTPATIGVYNGVPTVGLTTEQITELSQVDNMDKVSLRDLPVVSALGVHGGTTVAATAFLAHHAGVKVFSTGGLGGVHHGASETFDESADMTTLAQVPIVVISAGVKSILDVAATLERFETLNIPVIGYGTTKYPGFYVSDSGFKVNYAVKNTDEAAKIINARDDLGLPQSVLLANPVAEDKQLPRKSSRTSWPAPGAKPKPRASAATPAPRSCLTSSSATPRAAAWKSTSTFTAATWPSAASSPLR
uniref:pseudouridine-5'-phosphate glycosidase n=1 Tax=Arthrobacter sp. ERGS1:01 TaxID=1704044 RepID=UPI000A8B9FDB|nr:pseudouridine-5'-phosphate glycosidase [Arthrobacter sp. ERGS1:01]